MHDDWHTADIVAALKKRGHSQSGLAIDNGYHRTAVGKARQKPWSAVERTIATAIGVAPQTIWTSRYAKNGEPFPRVTRDRRSG